MNVVCSSSLRFNAVAEWWEEYIAYEDLKNQIYTLEKQATLSSIPPGSIPYADLEANEETSLVPSSQTDAVFVPLLDKELRKVSLFYEAQEKALLDELEELEGQVTEQELKGMADRYEDEWDSAEDDEDEVNSLRHSRDLSGSFSPSGSALPPKRRRRMSSSAGRGARNSLSIGECNTPR